MLFKCPLEYSQGSASSSNTISLHPSKPIIAKDHSYDIEIQNFRIKGIKDIMKTKSNSDQLLFSPCGYFIVQVH